MKRPSERILVGWGVAAHVRGGPAILRATLGQPCVFPTREAARKEAKRVRFLGLCATPVRVRVTVERIGEG